MALTQSEDGELGAALGPVASSERISTLDSLRGIAVLGILLLNIPVFGFPLPAVNDPSVYGGAEGANLIVWVVNNLFIEGTMRGLFSLLFGAGVILLTSRMESRGGGQEVAEIYYRRILWLIVFGLAHSWVLLWQFDILYFYGVVGLFLFPLRTLSPRSLVIVAVLAMSANIPRSMLALNAAVEAQAEAQTAQQIVDAGGELDQDERDAVERWAELVEETKPAEETLEKVIAGMRGGYLSVQRTISPRLQQMHAIIPYSWFFLSTIATMLIGMALFKLGILTGVRSVRFYITMIVCGYGLGLAINFYEAINLIRSDFDIIAVRRWGFGSLLYEFARLPMCLGHVALVVLICKQGWLSRLMRSLAAVGRMALSNYVMHSVICAFVFYGFGLALFGQLERYELYYVVFGIWVLQLLISPVWLRHYRFGPLEWLWRSLTYWKLQPFRREQSPPDLLAGTA